MNSLAGARVGFENWSLWIMRVLKVLQNQVLPCWTWNRWPQGKKKNHFSKSCVVLINHTLFVLVLSLEKCLLKGCISLLETPGPGVSFGWGFGAATNFILMMKNINKPSTDTVQMLKLRTFTLSQKMFCTALCQTGHDMGQSKWTLRGP